MKRSLLFLLAMIPLSLFAQQAFLALHADSYDFGRIGEYDGLVTTTFTFTNTGSNPLVITDVRATCSCTVTKYSIEPIAPNGQGWITVSYNPNGRPGKFSRTVTIKSNAANGKDSKLRISGEVIAGGRGITKNNNNASIAIGTDHKPSAQPVVINNPISQVDKNIPLTNSQSTNTYVLIIANEKYTYLNDVSYAANDGHIFKDYCIKTLGVPEKQIFYYENATYGNIADGVGRIKYCLNNFEGGRAIVYYCGHGIPDEKTRQAYLIPTDGKGTYMETCYSLSKLYKTLAETKAESITYFMDACFTGSNRDGDMLVTARGVALKPKSETLTGKSIVFSASSSDETAMALKSEGHGLFTYFLLKKLQETKGNVTYGELADYINKNVKKDAFLINDKPQTPTVTTSQAVEATWKTMKLK